jgi:hypothetical protein
MQEQVLPGNAEVRMSDMQNLAASGPSNLGALPKVQT